MTKEEMDKAEQFLKTNFGITCDQKEGWQGSFWHSLLEAMVSYASQSKWVSVEESVPQPNSKILIVVKRGHLNIVDIGYWDTLEIRTRENTCDIITHWQPLPSTEGIK